jgi:hypothetical protein
VKIIEFGPTWFRLPDDFVGGVPEALRALADAYEAGFKRTSSQKRRGRPSKLTEAYDTYREERIGKFFRAIAEGATLDGLLTLMEGTSEADLKEVDVDRGWKK